MKTFPQYLHRLALENGLAGAPPSPQAEVEWLFLPGMLQESWQMWWADFGTRATCHEGIDICYYRQGTGPVTPLPPGARVPAMAPGQVLNISADLLGSSIVISLSQASGARPGAVMVYSHLEAAPGLAVGDEVLPGRIIGETYDTRKKNSRLLSHLHLSCICLPEGPAGDALNWSLFADRDRVVHINPVFL